MRIARYSFQYDNFSDSACGNHIALTSGNRTFLSGAPMGKYLRIASFGSSSVTIPRLQGGGSKDFSFSFWIRHISSQPASTTFSDVLSFTVQKSDGNTTTLRLENLTNGTELNWYGDDVVTNSGGLPRLYIGADVWHHIVLTWSHVDKVFRQYMDGVFHSTCSPAYLDWSLTGNFCGFGDSGGCYCDLGDVQFFDHCLSLFEVSQLNLCEVLHWSNGFKDEDVSGTDLYALNGNSVFYSDDCVRGENSFEFVGNSLQYLYNSNALTQRDSFTLMTYFKSGRIFPDGYSYVPYIQSSGTQWINTNYYPTSSTHIRFKFSLEGVTSESYDKLFGVEDTSSSDVVFWSEIANSNYLFGTRFGNGVGTDTYSNLSMHGIYSIEFKDKAMKLNNLVLKNYTENFTSNCSLYLFALNYKNTVNSPCCIRLYECIISDLQGIAHHYVPAKRDSDGVLGLYDIRTGSFLENNGTGTFTTRDFISSRQYIAGRGRDCYSTGASIFLESDGKICCEWGGDASNNALHGTIYGPVVRDDGLWHHVVMTYDPSATPAVCFYLDGNLVDSSNDIFNGIDYSNNNAFVVGKMAFEYTGTTYYFPFEGLINDVRIFGKQLSLNEIKQIENSSFYIDNCGGLTVSRLGSFTGENNSLNTSSYKTKYFAGKRWIMLLRQNNKAGGRLFSKADNLEQCFYADTSNLYSRFADLDNRFKIGGKFEFLLEYPDITHSLSRYSIVGGSVSSGSTTCCCHGYSEVLDTEFRVAEKEGVVVCLTDVGIANIISLRPSSLDSTVLEPTIIRQLSIPNYVYTSITYGNGMFVAVVHDSNKYIYSHDAETWYEGTLPFSQYWSSIAYGNGVFVAVAMNSGNIVYSRDGINWTTVSVTSRQYIKVIYGNGKFLIISSGSTAILYSIDGSTWETARSNTATAWYDITYNINAKTYVMVAHDSNQYSWSYDGVHWTDGNFSISGITHIISGDGIFLALSSSINYCYSYDGISWTSASLPVDSGDSLLGALSRSDCCFAFGEFIITASLVTNAVEAINVFRSQYNQWTQIKNPIETHYTDLSSSLGTEYIHVDWATRSFGGLNKNDYDNHANSFMKCSANAGSLWYYAIGGLIPYTEGGVTGIPGPGEFRCCVAGITELWVRYK